MDEKVKLSFGKQETAPPLEKLGSLPMSSLEMTCVYDPPSLCELPWQDQSITVTMLFDQDLYNTYCCLRDRGDIHNLCVSAEDAPNQHVTIPCKVSAVYKSKLNETDMLNVTFET